MPHLPLVYSRITVGIKIVPLVTKACKRCRGYPGNAQTVIGVVMRKAVTSRQVVTFFVISLSLQREFHSACRYGLRHVVGKYFPSRLLGAHVQLILPAWLIGDSTRYSLLI